MFGSAGLRELSALGVVWLDERAIRVFYTVFVGTRLADKQTVGSIASTRRQMYNPIDSRS